MTEPTDHADLARARLRIAVPSRGRLAEATEDLLGRAGLAFRRRERRLYASCRDTDVGIVFARAADIPTLVGEGVVDLGVTGSDLVSESSCPLSTLLELDFGRCSLVVAVRRDGGFESPVDLAGHRIGTKYPQVTADYFAKLGIEVHPIVLSGTLEVMVSLGLVDAIVDVTETGDSLEANHLRPLDTVLESKTVLVALAGREPDEYEATIVRRIEGVLHARRYSMLEYNCPASRFEEARAVTPGYRSPTVVPLADSDWLSVKVMVLKSEPGSPGPRDEPSLRGRPRGVSRRRASGLLRAVGSGLHRPPGSASPIPKPPARSRDESVPHPAPPHRQRGEQET